MKIRIKGNSLRYRLSKTDIANLALDGFVQEQIDFAGQSLTYVLKTTGKNWMSTDLSNYTITLFLPKEMADEMITTSKVGFEDASGDIYLLVEKDFTCTEAVEEDQSDNYPNPSVGSY